MNLVDLPHELWRQVFVQWLTVREVSSVDHALGLLLVDTPTISLRMRRSSIHTGLARTEEIMVGIGNKCNDDIQAERVTRCQLANMFKWSADRIRVAILLEIHNKLPEILASIAQYCRRLVTLHVKGNTPADQEIQSVVQNNKCTLQTLILDMSDQIIWRADGRFPSEHYMLPQLRVLMLIGWSQHNGGTDQLLRKCPNLISLNICGITLPQSMVDTYSLLLKLQFDDVRDVRDDQLLKIFQHCRKIHWVHILECKGLTTRCLATVTQTLPCLQTLMSDIVDDSLLFRLAACGVPSLRSLYTVNLVNVASVRAFTASCPQLTSLRILLLARDTSDNIQSVFEFCGNVREMSVCSTQEDVINAAIESISMYCPLLHTLYIPDCDFDEGFIPNLWASCTQLCRLVVSDEMSCYILGPEDNRDAVISDEYDDALVWPPEYHSEG